MNSFDGQQALWIFGRSSVSYGLPVGGCQLDRDDTSTLPSNDHLRYPEILMNHQHNQSDPSSQPHRLLAVLGIPFDDVSFEDVLAWISRRVRDRHPAYIATVNLDFIMQAWRDPEQQRILLEADLVVADGFPIIMLSKLMGMKLKERVTGSDLTPMLAGLSAREGCSLYLLGGAKGVPEAAAAKLAELSPGVRIAGCYSPPKADLLDMDHAEILNRLEAAKPDILLVAFGAPKQEKWVHMHKHAWTVPVSIGVGGTLDFLAGTQKRAPKIFQRLYLEWLWRMFSDPRRLFKRYAGNLWFLVTATLRMLYVRYGRMSAVHKDRDRLDELALADVQARRVVLPPLSTVEECEAFLAAALNDSNGWAVVVDLQDREWLNPMEIGACIQLVRRSRFVKSAVHVLAAHPRTYRQLQWMHLDTYLQAESSAPAMIASLRQRLEQVRQGQVTLDDAKRLHILLPAELTAATLPQFREQVQAVWDEAEISGVRVDASVLSFLDSTALGYLMTVKRAAANLTGGYSGTDFHGNALQTLKIARLDGELLVP